ncbi:hypothetical protein C9F11_26730 [Streptomyces sp. YIM 121038]|uniref:hypothetical protein n=1 Tax=Streptomyces sp. YIM 121038 TaxID=2136401 RepID=UPI001110598B|nr:hypothetical protein [Streptomyces sp. YIM 121038]QCX78956.1 hypothetical protein C9F11_26730 [Streptomyces sp. YIM 121038]
MTGRDAAAAAQGRGAAALRGGATGLGGEAEAAGCSATGPGGGVEAPGGCATGLDGGAKAPGGGAFAPSRGAQSPRRGTGDPVKALLHRHRELCERAVDPLEIAAGLEAHGVTDRTAARFRHRDVFALAEEMYARVPRDSDEWDALDAPGHGSSGRPAGAAPEVHAAWPVFALLPGAVCALTVAGLALTTGGVRLAVGLGGAFALAATVRVALRHGPLRTPRPAASATRAWTCWLLAYALCGEGLLRAAAPGGTDRALPPSALAALGLAAAVVPGTACARLFTVRARRRLGRSRGLADFAASVRPLLLGVFALYATAVGLALAGADAALGLAGAAGAGGVTPCLGVGALAALLWLGRLLAAHGSTRAPALVYAAVGATGAAALALAWAARLPGCGFLATPVETAALTWGVPAAVCGAGAALLLARAVRVLGRASAHACGGAA